ncbi:MAG: dihydroorotase [Actinomycetota bacterium]|nr:dihydroorotase [Actinomycetota bacterium]
MTEFVVRGGLVVDPASDREGPADIGVSDTTITEVGSIREGRATEVDAAGCVIAPALVDLHTHAREPGREDEETIATCSAAAAAGGFGAICTMPNTDPVADTAAVVEKVWAAGREVGLVDVFPAGAISRGQRGEKMADLGEMARSVAGVRLFTDDGRGVQDSLLARRAMEYLLAFDAVYAEHCEDEALVAGGQMHEGDRSAILGLRGIPAEAEELMAGRDIALARLTGCRLHLLHVSTAGTVELVRAAKLQGVRITAEATPHHFTLTEEAVTDYDPGAKVNPPLRTEADRAAIKAALVDGTLDAIATDHAPHSVEEKDVEFEFASPGLVGLETALALTLTELVHSGDMTLMTAVDRLSTGPAGVLGLTEHGGPIAPGRPANFVVFDPDAAWTVDPAGFHSKSRNTPFKGRELKGRVRHNFLRGRPTVTDGRVVGALV